MRALFTLEHASPWRAGLWGSTCTWKVRLPPSVVAEPLEELPRLPLFSAL